MISATQIRNGIAAGVVHFIADPNSGSGTVCAIGDNWFYFGGEPATQESPEEYLAHVSIEHIVKDIVLVLDDFRRYEGMFDDEYKYYEAVLKEAEEAKKKDTFALGQLAMTRGVADLTEEDHGFSAFVERSMARYIRCDWGDTCAEDQESNNDAVAHGDRILAEYREKDHPDWRIWIITEWDRSVTTILFPDEY